MATNEHPTPEDAGRNARDFARVFEVAQRVCQAKPWECLAESDIFAVVNPEDGTTGFVSVCGSEGKEYAIFVYLGVESLFTYWDSMVTPGFQQVRVFVEAPMLKISFEDRSFLEVDDLKLIKESGIVVRGRKRWPMLRAVQAGYFGEIPTPAESRFLAVVLEQLLELLPRIEEDPAFLTSSEVDIFTRIPRLYEGRLVWKDTVLSYPPVMPKMHPMPIPSETLQKWSKCKSSGPIEVDLFLTPLREKLENSRERALYILLVVDSGTGFILGHELMGANPTLQDMWNLCGFAVASALIQSGICPSEIQARHPAILRGLAGISGSIGTRVVEKIHLPRIAEVTAILMRDYIGRDIPGWCTVNPG